MGGAMAAGLTAMMILLFLGNWRLTLIILATIPLAIITAVLIMYEGGQTLNTMTLGGFALAVGILVDNGTVVIENIERHLHEGDGLTQAIVVGCGEVAVPTVLSTIAICIVFVPVFLLQGTAKYLFSPLSLSVCVSLIASLALSFTLVPVLFAKLMRSTVEAQGAGSHAAPRSRFNFFSAFHHRFERGFHDFREAYRNNLAYCVGNPAVTGAFFVIALVCSLMLFPQLGEDFFPSVDAGQMRLHVRAPPASRLETTQHYFAEVESTIREIVGSDQIEVVLDNIGLPYSGINIALSDSATVGPMDGEILISLKEKHRPTPAFVATLRRELPKRFPELQFFFQPADIVNQVLNFGQPAPIDVRIAGPDGDKAFALAQKIAADLKSVPGVVDSHVFQVPDAPALSIDVDRTLAEQLGLSQDEVAKNVLVGANSSAQTSPNFWIDPRNNVSYPLVVQVPTYRVNTIGGHGLVAGHGGQVRAQRRSLLENIAKFVDGVNVPLAISGAAPTSSAGFRRQRRCAGPRPRFRRRRHRQSARDRSGRGAGRNDGDSQRPSRNHARGILRFIFRNGARRGSGVSDTGDQFSELGRSGDRPGGRSVHFGRRDVDVVLDADPSQRARPDGVADVHRPDLGKQHSGGHVRQSAHGGGRRQSDCRRHGRLYATASRHDDRRGNDSGHDPDGFGRRRRRRTERAPGACGDRRPDVRNHRHADIRAGRVPTVAVQPATRFRFRRRPRGRRAGSIASAVDPQGAIV